jgi:membrane protease YdiL (CAAX protease family)
VSTFQDPLPEPGTPIGPEISLAQIPPPIEDPVWSGWDVFWIAMVTIFSVVFFIFATAYVTHRLFYPKTTFTDVMQFPLVTIVAQVLAYLVVLVFMISIVEGRPGERFWSAIKWKWPQNPWMFILAGVILSLGLQLLGQLLPMPKDLPIDRFFKTSIEVWAISIFGVTIVPLMEELFFRGFLYPVLARRLGLPIAVGITSILFGCIHGAQLGWTWAPVLIVSLVGVALTLTRAKTKSVAAGVLMHMAYNGTLFGLGLFFGNVAGR